MYDAPLTESMWADWAARASRRRMGAAYALICTDRDELSVSRSATTSVIRLPSTTTRTWTSPNAVCSVAPVKERGVGLVVCEVDELDGLGGCELDDECDGVEVRAVALWVDFVRVADVGAAVVEGVDEVASVEVADGVASVDEVDEEPAGGRRPRSP